MLKYSFGLLLTVCLLQLLVENSLAAPRPQSEQQQAAVNDQADDLEAGAEAGAEKEELQGSESVGYGYYSSPYLGGYYGGYPHYSTYYGGGLGYPFYSGYGGYGGFGGYGGYGGYHGHGHYGHYF